MQQRITCSKNSYANDYLSKFIFIVSNELVTLGFSFKGDRKYSLILPVFRLLNDEYPILFPLFLI